jgi:uncharacterized protein YjbI with pentapeptide repeats
MSEVMKKCKYKSKVTNCECPYEALYDSSEGFCIFHDRRKGKDIKKFNEGIKKILEDENSDAYHFEGFFFPESINFEGSAFKKSVFFCGAEFSGNNTNFSLVEFAGEKTDFSGARFSGEFTNFGESKFLGKETDFGGAVFSGEDTGFDLAMFLAEKTCFFETKFLGENIYFSEAQFSGKNTDFFNAKFLGKKTVFSHAKFLGENIYFHSAKFSGENTYFQLTVFSGENISFIGAQFSGDEVNFEYSKFLKKILFQGTIFEAKTIFTGVDLRKCVFRAVDLKNIDFSLVDWDWKYKLRNETDVPKEDKHESYFMTSEIYRQLKVHFYNKRDFAKAGMFHYREQECKRMACKLPRQFFKWFFLLILRRSCGYGEKLRNVVRSSVALVLIFGIIYMFLGLHNTDQNESLLFQYSLKTSITTSLGTILKDFWTSLIFSIKGFFPLWRFQQYKVVGDFANLIAGVEFLLGAFMVGLFVYVFRRRMDK